jgi:hypothetical protein
LYSVRDYTFKASLWSFQKTFGMSCVYILRVRWELRTIYLMIVDLFSDANMVTILSFPVRQQQQQRPPSTFTGADMFYHFGYVSFGNYHCEKRALWKKLCIKISAIGYSHLIFGIHNYRTASPFRVGQSQVQCFRFCRA